MITVGQIFDHIFCLHKYVNGIIYNDDSQNDSKFRFCTSRYMMDQVFNYIFKNTFEQLDPIHGSPDINIIRKIISTEYEVQEICTQIITKIKPIIQAMHCILRDCDPNYYGEGYKHDTIFKHGEPLSYEKLTHPNIYKHHVVLREKNENQKSTHSEKSGDYLIYSKQGKLIKFIMLCQHPDSLIESLKTMNTITSTNSVKVDNYYYDMDNYKKSNEMFAWTFDDRLYLLQKIATSSHKLNSKTYQKMKSISIIAHKDLISQYVNQILKYDY